MNSKWPRVAGITRAIAVTMICRELDKGLVIKACREATTAFTCVELGTSRRRSRKVLPPIQPATAWVLGIVYCLDAIFPVVEQLAGCPERTNDCLGGM